MSHGKSGWFVPDEALTPAGVVSPFAGLPWTIVQQLQADPADHIGLAGVQWYFSHFNAWDGPVAEGAAGGWTLSGATGAATVVLTSTRNGEIALTADGTADATPTLQLGSATLGANYRYVAGKRAWCFARIKPTVVATQEIFFGLGTPDTSPTVTGTLPADGIFVEKALTATKFDCHARQDGTSTESALAGATLVDATYTVIGFTVNKRGDITFYQDGLVIATVAAGNANIPDAVADVLQLMVGIKGASQVLTLDWLLAAEEL